jgi:hypothetical protein
MGMLTKDQLNIAIKALRDDPEAWRQVKIRATIQKVEGGTWKTNAPLAKAMPLLYAATRAALKRLPFGDVLLDQQVYEDVLDTAIELADREFKPLRTFTSEEIETVVRIIKERMPAIWEKIKRNTTRPDMGADTDDFGLVVTKLRNACKSAPFLTPDEVERGVYSGLVSEVVNVAAAEARSSAQEL